jgi:S-adenosyl-L-methionine hydrolase (adenosine-forming)
MSIITLISDWGLNDYTVSAVKGHILTIMPEATIVDISHTIEPFNRKTAAYILNNAYRNFPEGTVHIIGVCTTESAECKHIAFKLNNHYFVSADNGIPALLIEQTPPDKIIELSVPQDSYRFTFSERDLFAKVAVHLAKGLPIDELGTPLNGFYPGSWIIPQEESNKIIGTIVFTDNYGNIVTNVSEELFKKYNKGKTFEIVLQVDYKITKISNSYEDVYKDEPVAIFNSSGYLEVGINQGNLFELLSYEIDSRITILFK